MLILVLAALHPRERRTSSSARASRAAVGSTEEQVTFTENLHWYRVRNKCREKPPRGQMNTTKDVETRGDNFYYRGKNKWVTTSTVPLQLYNEYEKIGHRDPRWHYFATEKRSARFWSERGRTTSPEQLRRYNRMFGRLRDAPGRQTDRWEYARRPPIRDRFIREREELPARPGPPGLQWDPRKNKSLSLRIFTGIGLGTSVERNHHEE
ncbi:hypothetical protein J6590_049855 [Homalodisca vitripennis]|nr:hypothetical protein J6590_049855 [Homalodisca vitripennis]